MQDLPVLAFRKLAGRAVAHIAQIWAPKGILNLALPENKREKLRSAFSMCNFRFEIGGGGAAAPAVRFNLQKRKMKKF